MQLPANSDNGEERGFDPLTGRFLDADEGDLYFLSAVGTGDVQGDGLPHDAFRDGGDDGIDVIEPVVEEVEVLPEARKHFLGALVLLPVFLRQTESFLSPRECFIIGRGARPCQRPEAGMGTGVV